MWTGAGLSACLDLAHVLVADDHGQDVALRVVRQPATYLKRPGGQSQFNVSLDPVSTVMGQAVVRNRATDGVLIKDFTEPGGLHVLIGLAGAGASIVMQLRQVLTSPAVAQDEASLTADAIMRVKDPRALAAPSLVWSLPAIFLYGDSFGWWNAVALALVVAAVIALWLIQIRSAGVATAARRAMAIVIDAASPTPPFEQLRAQLARQIQDRSLAVGTRLPPIRRLPADLGFAVNTVGRGLPETEGGRSD